MNYIVFGVIRDGAVVFIARGSIAQIPGIVRQHQGMGSVVIARYLSELEALGLEYQLLYDVKPVDNTNIPTECPWTYPAMLYRKYNIDMPALTTFIGG